MFEGVELTISYTPVSSIRYLHIIINIVSEEVLTISFLDISKTSQNSILPNPEEMVYLSLPHIYPEWFKIKYPKHPLDSINQKMNLHSIHQINPRKKTCWEIML